MQGYQIIDPTAPAVPLVVSVPHCGIAFPPELIDQYKPELSAAPDDTDLFVDRLYDFAPSLGITMITAQYSRWVIDLNRDPQSKPLYSDGRIITALCPTTDFFGNNIYVDNRTEVEASELARRVERYYQPYHHQLQILLNRTAKKFGKVLLWDCHSIRQWVPTIRKEKFPDLILGDADETSCSSELIELALKTLSSAAYGLQHNDPFKGGYITRAYGQPEQNRFALQLEMSKVHYMDDSEKSYHPDRAEKMRHLLKRNFEGLISNLVPSPLPLSPGRGVTEVRGRGEGIQWSRAKISPQIFAHARAMRKSPTDAEAVLWNELKDRKFNGYKFRRQHPFEGFILDFYCEELHLAIEVDGAHHLTKEEKTYDQLRTEYLNEFGISVLRFTNQQVKSNVSEILKIIFTHINPKI